VEGPACKYIEIQGLFKENGLIEPWIFDPTAAAAVDRAVSPVHGSTAAVAVESKIHSSIKPVSLKSPWISTYLHVGPSTYINLHKQVRNLMF
jgi:hypothetical protein